MPLYNATMFGGLYIGDLSDPGFKMEGGDWNGNLPRRLTPDFPPSQHPNNKIEPRTYDWRQVDWGGYVVKVSKRDIIDLIQFRYGSDPSYTDPEKMMRWEGKAYLVEILTEIRKVVSARDDNGEYALVRYESPGFSG